MKEIIEILDPKIEIIPYSNGFDALDNINDTIDCIITDYNMPHMDGLELSSKLKELIDKPIIFYTRECNPELVSKAFDLGVDGFIQKREDLEVYYELISEVRRNYQRYLLSNQLEENKEGKTVRCEEIRISTNIKKTQ
jgi:PleD family two-component response regulator